MKYLVTLAAGIGVAWCMAGGAGAAPMTLQTIALWAPPEQIVVWQVDSAAKSQQGGIVNERSTGNEPFMGPGASGGPTHSAPGATENTVKRQPRDMESGGSRAGKGGESMAQQGRPSESNPVTQEALERNAEQGGGAAVAAEVLKEEGTGSSK